MTPESAGELCDRLDQSLRGSELNLTAVANTVVLVLRDGAWRRRRIRTGEVVECASFLELLTAAPLKGFGEDPKHVEALLKDDAEALRMFREATTAPKHRPRKGESNSNIITSPQQGTTRAYTLDRLHRDAPALYADVVAGTLTANQAAIRAGFRRVKSPLERLSRLWHACSDEERAAFLAWIRAQEEVR